MSGPFPSTDGNQVPPLGPDLEDLLEDLTAVHCPGVDQIVAGLRYIALTRHTVDRTQTLISVLAGGSDGLNLVTAIGEIVARLADADTNPALRTLPINRQKDAQRAGELAHLALTDPELHQTAADTCGAIDGI
ncbi:hypothetical protein AB0M00_43480 [Streptomyces chartreusis]|uniref:hypothetical protein n=1 Tax=Streptomyces chartreusis TaxID=1969 RepID=UPI00341D0CCA